MYRPKDAERLVLYLKDINLPKPDKWGTSMLIAFLQQVGVHTIINLISVCTKDWDQRYVSPLLLTTFFIHAILEKKPRLFRCNS